MFGYEDVLGDVYDEINLGELFKLVLLCYTSNDLSRWRGFGWVFACARKDV